MKIEIKDVKIGIHKHDFASVGFEDGQMLTIEELEQVNKAVLVLHELGVDNLIIVRR